jgi:acylphosphatase
MVGPRSPAISCASIIVGATLQRVSRRFLVSGRVQGVYFRHSTRLEAERLGLAGVARNLPDGSVEVIAHGSATALESLHLWLHRGPAEARVREVRELDPPAAGASVAPDPSPVDRPRFSIE